MSLESAFRSMILSISSVTSLVSQRVFPGIIPENETLPAIRYLPVSGTREHSHDGVSGFQVQRIQVDCYAKTYAEVIALAAALEAGMDGFNGSSPATFAITLESDSDVYEEVPRIWRRQMDFVVQYEY